MEEIESVQIINESFTNSMSQPNTQDSEFYINIFLMVLQHVSEKQ